MRAEQSFFSFRFEPPYWLCRSAYFEHARVHGGHPALVGRTAHATLAECAVVDDMELPRAADSGTPPRCADHPPRRSSHLDELVQIGRLTVLLRLPSSATFGPTCRPYGPRRRDCLAAPLCEIDRQFGVGDYAQQCRNSRVAAGCVVVAFSATVRCERRYNHIDSARRRSLCCRATILCTNGKSCRQRLRNGVRYAVRTSVTCGAGANRDDRHGFRRNSAARSARPFVVAAPAGGPYCWLDSGHVAASGPRPRQPNTGSRAASGWCRPVRPRPEPSVGSRAHHEHTDIHSGHENSSDLRCFRRSEP